MALSRREYRRPRYSRREPWPHRGSSRRRPPCVSKLAGAHRAAIEQMHSIGRSTLTREPLRLIPRRWRALIGPVITDREVLDTSGRVARLLEVVAHGTILAFIPTR